MQTIEPLDAIYPSSDGKPMAENTRQYDAIAKIVGGIRTVFQDNPNVFVAGDLLWYPVEGKSSISAAPDCMVAIGRPKGHRKSYIQFMEENVAPQVAFEVTSPSNTSTEMVSKLAFYEKYGVQEYYVYDPEHATLDGYLRTGQRLNPIDDIQNGWTSPILNVAMKIEDGELVMTGPDGTPFHLVEEANRELQQLKIEAKIDKAHSSKLEKTVQKEKQRADGEKQRADGEKQRADSAERKLEELKEKLRELGIDP
jgi:Uma2 family endonuclease